LLTLAALALILVVGSGSVSLTKRIQRAQQAAMPAPATKKLAPIMPTMALMMKVMTRPRITVTMK